MLAIRLMRAGVVVTPLMTLAMSLGLSGEAAGLAGAASQQSRAALPATIRVSVGDSGVEADSGSGSGKVSTGCGRIAFTSSASNLAAGDSNRFADVFLRDRAAGSTRLVSRAVGGEKADGASLSTAISSHGRYVAFESSATNLVELDTNDMDDVFVRDMTTPTVELVSVPAGGESANGASHRAVVSDNGRFVAFDSRASNLVADDTVTGADVFVRDRSAHTTERVSVGLGGVDADGESTDAAISGDGRYVAFQSRAENLVEGDTNGAIDVFVYDRELAHTELVSVGLAGAVAKGASVDVDISADGRFVAFTSLASNLVDNDLDKVADVFVRDRLLGTTTRVSTTSAGAEANDQSLAPTVSDDGQVVTFDSDATNLVRHDTNRFRDSFVHYAASGVTRRISVSSSGAQADRGSLGNAIAGSGRCAAFTSPSALVPGDTNLESDVMLRILGPVPT